MYYVYPGSDKGMIRVSNCNYWPVPSHHLVLSIYHKFSTITFNLLLSYLYSKSSYTTLFYRLST
jgi:hypothetical protein